MYCTRAEIEANRIPRTHLLDLVDDERLGEFDNIQEPQVPDDNEAPLFSDETSKVNQRIRECIETATSIIDSFLVDRYVVPLAEIPALINTICLDITVYRLYLRRNNVSEEILGAKNDAMKLLEKIQSRKISLPLVENVAPLASPNSSIAVRTREKLKW